jgi:DNA-directed RNA polymerase specialized sigma24 family protein
LRLTGTIWRQRRDDVAAALHRTGHGHPQAAAHSQTSGLIIREHLPAGQRAVVVLRYWMDLSEAETAAALG